MLKNEQNLVLGRGRLYWDQFAPGTTVRSGQERYIGNTTNLSVTASNEKKDHYDSDSKVKVKDRSVLISVDHMGKFTTDQVDVDNMALFLLGSSEALIQAAIAVDTDFPITVVKGFHYQIGHTDANSGGLTDLTVSAVVGGGAVAAPLADTDYVLDAKAGRIYIPTSSNLDNGDVLTITLQAAPVERSRTISGNLEIRGALRFLADNAEGENANFYMRNTRLMPNGEMLLKGDEWQEMSFDLECLTLGTTPAIERNGQPFNA